MTVSSLTTFTLAAAALSLAIWSYRRFGVTMFIWLILARTSGGIASLAVSAPNPEKAQKACEHLQKQMESKLSEALQTIYIIPNTLSLLSTLLLLLVVAAELGHMGPKIAMGYDPHLLLRLAYRCRFFIGIGAVLCAIGPSVFLSYVMKTGL